MPQPPPNGDELRRIDIVKQLFFAFANRHVAYQYKSVIGLTTFATKAVRWCHATENLGTFQHHIDMTEADGRTALLDALALATEELSELGAKYVGPGENVVVRGC